MGKSQRPTWGRHVSSICCKSSAHFCFSVPVEAEAASLIKAFEEEGGLQVASGDLAGAPKPVRSRSSRPLHNVSHVYQHTVHTELHDGRSKSIKSGC